jgi:pimeloyl-ACP methyl ester carboxylesterase
MNERTRTVEVGAQPIFVHEWGDPGGGAVLFVHGTGDDGGQARALAAALPAMRVAAPDVPGHGRSSSAEPPGYLPTAMVTQLAGLLDALAIESAALVGFSWGASIACHFAARHPERARSLVLLEGGHLDFQDLVDFDPAALPPQEDVQSAMGRGLVADPVVSTYPALRQSGVPILLVTALRDEAVAQLRVDPLARLQREVPQAEVARVPGYGHDILGGDDGSVVQLVRDWLLAH